jgi:hypothetical protein
MRPFGREEFWIWKSSHSSHKAKPRHANVDPTRQTQTRQPWCRLIPAPMRQCDARARGPAICNTRWWKNGTNEYINEHIRKKIPRFIINNQYRHATIPLQFASESVSKQIETITTPLTHKHPWPRSRVAIPVPWQPPPWPLRRPPCPR